MGVLPPLMQAVYAAVYYLRATVLPQGTRPVPSAPGPADALDPRFLTALAVVAVAVPLLLVLRARAVLAACAAFLLIVLPVLGLAQSGPQLVADRYSYLACMPFALLLAGGLRVRELALAARRATPWACAALCVVRGCSAWRAGPWSRSGTTT
jgi:hypothetical protein